MGLSVGSIAHRFDAEGDSQIGGRSPFSRVGLGPASTIKPDLVHVGGNLFSGVNSFSDTGYQANVYRGTSFSTPRVSALAATLEHRLNRPFDALLVKALLVHSASYPLLPNDEGKSLMKEYGFGKPALIDEILFNDPSEFTMIWHPHLQDGVDMQIQDIPFPESLVENGQFIGEITVTVVTNPVLRDSEKSEYCQSDVKVSLQSYDRIEYYVLNAAGTPRTYRNSERLVNAQNILTKDRYKSSSFSSTNIEERTIICSEEYLPIKKYHVNLEQMRPAHKNSCLNSNRKWCLGIEVTYRDATVTDKSFGNDVGTVDAVIIITIKDPRRMGTVYDECLQALEEHNFAHSDIVVRQNINLINE
jgi:hypothetical protein